MGKDNIVDRISLALQTLKKEMDDLRVKDVELMKQLMYVRNTIQTITRQRRRRQHSWGDYNQQRRSISSCIPEQTHEIHAECHRRLSYPVSDYSNSLEDVSFSEEFGETMENEDDLFDEEDQPSQRPSLPITKDFNTSICDEDLLKTNIRVWKFSKAELLV